MYTPEVEKKRFVGKTLLAIYLLELHQLEEKYKIKLFLLIIVREFRV